MTNRPAQISALSTETLNTVHATDCRAGLASLPAESIHLVLTDIPYGIGVDQWDVLHDNTNSAYLGSSPAQERAGAVFSKRGKPINGWSAADREIPRQYYEWCCSWATECYRVLRPGASILVFAGRRLAHRCVAGLEDCGFSYKDTLAWIRPRAPHRAQRLSAVYERRGDSNNARRWHGWRVGNLRPRFEPIQWLCKPYRQGGTIADNMITNGVGAYNEHEFVSYNTSPDNIIESAYDPEDSGLHPTQKPLNLFETLVALASSENQIVLDPFAGSGTTLLAAQRLNRSFIGFEIDPKFADVASRRLQQSPTNLF